MTWCYNMRREISIRGQVKLVTDQLRSEMDKDDPNMYYVNELQGKLMAYRFVLNE